MRQRGCRAWTGAQRASCATREIAILAIIEATSARDSHSGLPTSRLICPNMKLTSLEDILKALQTMSPSITVAPEIRERARLALDRMLAVPRD